MWLTSENVSKIAKTQSTLRWDSHLHQIHALCQHLESIAMSENNVHILSYCIRNFEPSMIQETILTSYLRKRNDLTNNLLDVLHAFGAFGGTLGHISAIEILLSETNE